MAKKARRSRRTGAEWREVLARYEASGLGPAAFCRREGLVLATFHRWKARLALTEPAGRFVELEGGGSGEEVWAMELELPHGVVLRIRG